MHRLFADLPDNPQITLQIGYVYTRQIEVGIPNNPRKIFLQFLFSPAGQVHHGNSPTLVQVKTEIKVMQSKPEKESSPKWQRRRGYLGARGSVRQRPTAQAYSLLATYHLPDF